MTTNAPSRSPLRLGLRASALAAAGGLGFLVAAQPQPATADGLPLPTVSIPSLPITVPTVTVPTVTVPPVTLPTTTDPGTTTAAGTGTTSSSAAATPGAPPATVGGSSGASAGGTTPSAAGTGVSGAIRLADGTFSIPVTSVHLPARLVLVVTVTPRFLQSQTQAINASIRVRDTRGFVVRGARVAVRSVPAGRLTASAQKRSGADGRATFVVRAKPAVLRLAGRLSLLVSAADPAKSRLVAVSRVVVVPIRPRR